MVAVSAPVACHLLLLHVGVLTSFCQWTLSLCATHVICCCSMSVSVPLRLELHAGAQRLHISDMSEWSGCGPRNVSRPGNCHVESAHL